MATINQDIFAVRLREPNKQSGWTMRSYTSAAGNRYQAGNVTAPSPLRIVTDPQELQELRAIPQFEILVAPSEAVLRNRIQSEMEARARTGLPAIRASLQGEDAPEPAPPVKPPVAKPKALETVLLPTPVGAIGFDDTQKIETASEDFVQVRVAPRAPVARPSAPPPPEPDVTAEPKRPSRSGGRKPSKKLGA